MNVRRCLHLVMLNAGLLFAACGGSEASTETTAVPAVDTTVPATDPTTTDAATTTAASTAPPTTLLPVIDLSTLPGLLAVNAWSCAPEPYVPPAVIEGSVMCTLKPDGSDVKVVSQPGERPVGHAFTRDGVHLWYGDPYTRFGYLINLTTGEHRERQRFEPLRSDVSPDGRLFLYWDGEGLSITNADGSNFPDGRTSVSVVDDIHVSPGSYVGPASWAPDGLRFAYLSMLDVNTGERMECAEIWVGAIDGTPPAKITDFASKPDGTEGCPESVRWSPTDDRILVHTLGKPIFTVENLFVINPDGSGLTPLTDAVPFADPDADTWAMAGSSYGGDWSPDGEYIVFILGNGTDYQLAVMRADGSQKTIITDAPLGITTGFIAIRWALG